MTRDDRHTWDPVAEPENDLEFEKLISDTSASLFEARPEQLELTIGCALEKVRRFFRADRCALLTVSADQQAVNVRLESREEEVASVSADTNLAQLFPWSRHTLLVDRAPVRVARLDDLPAEAVAEREAWKQMPIRSALTLPIETDGTVGHIIVLNTVHREREWPEAFVARLQLLGEILVGALERKKLIAELRVDITDRKRAQEALSRSEARLASGADLAGLAFYEVDFGERTIYLDDRFRALCGVPPDREQGLQPLEFWMEHIHPDDHPRVMEKREELHDGRSENASVEYRYLHPSSGEKWVAHLGRVARRDASGHAVSTYGVLRDITARKRFEEELVDLSRRLVRAHEEERALLARELHDDVTQRLALLAIQIGGAESDGMDVAQAETIKTVREGLVRLSEDVHSLAYQLHPSVLAELGLVEALRTECERLGRQGRLEISLNLDPLPEVVEKDAALCLFRVAQEALNNANRHAGVCEANVALRRMDGGLLLAVRDEGVGFDPESPRTGRNLGLASMRERVRLLNGTLDIESAPGQGTAVIAWVPTQGASR